MNSFTTAVFGTATLAMVALSSAACSNTPQNPAIGSTSGGAASPEIAISTYLTDVIEGNFRGACLMMGLPADDGAPPQPRGQTVCANEARDPQIRAAVMGIAKTVTPADAVKATTTVAVHRLPAAGTSVTASDTQVTVDGRPLHDVVAANTRGAESTVSFQAVRISDRWFVLGACGSSPLPVCGG